MGGSGSAAMGLLSLLPPPSLREVSSLAPVPWLSGLSLRRALSTAPSRESLLPLLPWLASLMTLLPVSLPLLRWLLTLSTLPRRCCCTDPARTSTSPSS